MRSSIGLALLALSAAACRKAAPPANTAAADSANMANMPGMTMPIKSDTTGASAGVKDDSSRQKPSGTVPLPATITFTAQQVQHGGVRWGPATIGTTATTVVVPGTLVPNEDRTARLGAPARGRVIDVRVQPGDRVERGHVLVTLQSADAAMAQADVVKATAEVTARRAQVQYAASARARAERLLALKAIPRQDYERAIADDEQARASLAQAEAEQRRAQSAAEQLGATTSAPGEIALRAPRSGVVLARPAVPGTVVEAGAPLVVVTDPATLWLRVSAPAQFAPLFRDGDRLRFSVPAYPGEIFTARVDAVSPGLDPDTRTLAVRGVLASASKLKAEMLASVTVSGGPSVSAPLLPDDAVQLLAEQPTVFLVRPDGKGGATFERRAVEVGARSAGRIPILRGLDPGAVVVTGGGLAVKAAFLKGAMPRMEM
ncbi:MAG TPA: efflux RND transporter periplasmic adaptor subunit [Gemmatimonadaceae bacterium]|nr:efflux RND transporter periplasmic adaptor subunit [Gemmatimonadaceae bacterium]